MVQMPQSLRRLWASMFGRRKQRDLQSVPERAVEKEKAKSATRRFNEQKVKPQPPPAPPRSGS
jgi:hypothetical protein